MQWGLSRGVNQHVPEQAYGFGSFIRCQNHSKPTKHTKEIKKADYICFSDFLLSNSKSVESCSSCQVAVRFPDGLLLPLQAIMHRVGGLMFCIVLRMTCDSDDEMWWCSNVANADYAYLSVSQWTPVLAERHHPSHASRNLRSEKRRMQSLWSIKVLWSLLQEQQAPRFLVNLFVHIHFKGCLSSQLTEFTLLRQEILEMFHFRWGWRFKIRFANLFSDSNGSKRLFIKANSSCSSVVRPLFASHAKVGKKHIKNHCFRSTWLVKFVLYLNSILTRRPWAVHGGLRKSLQAWQQRSHQASQGCDWGPGVAAHGFLGGSVNTSNITKAKHV